MSLLDVPLLYTAVRLATPHRLCCMPSTFASPPRPCAPRLHPYLRPCTTQTPAPMSFVSASDVMCLMCGYHSVHIHHWLYLIIIGLLLCWYDCFTGIGAAAIGMCAGGTLQGVVMYDDWHHVVFFKTPDPNAKNNVVPIGVFVLFWYCVFFAIGRQNEGR